MKINFLTMVFFLLVFSSNAFSLESANLVCKTIDCNTIASKRNIEFKSQDGIEILVSRLFKFTITNKVSNLTKLHKSIVLETINKHIFVVSDVGIGEFGLNPDDDISLSEFFKAIYLTKYSQLNQDEITPNSLIAIKAYKSLLRLSSKTNVIHFEVDSVAFYSFYDPASKNYEIHAISNSELKFGQKVTLVNVTEKKYFDFISSIIVK